MSKKPNMKKMGKIFDEIQVNAGVSEKKKKLSWFTKFLFFVDFCALICFFVAYGPISGPRDWLITTAMGTGKHKYFAYVLYSQNHVTKVVTANSFHSPGGATDVDAIKFVDYSNITVYKNEYERQILEHEEGQDYKIFEIAENGYSGYVAVVYDPTKLDLVVSNNVYGNEVSQLVALNGARFGVNGGGYYVDQDTYYKYPIDNIILDGKVYYDKGSAGSFIGMNFDGVLMLYQGTCSQAIADNMKWGLEFGPYLIVNGKSATFSGNGGGGYQPRTAIGQRADGVIIILVIDGRGGNGSAGATFVDLLHIFERYECINAANLDGGGSSVMVNEGVVLNNPVSYQGTGERNVLNAIILK